MSEVKVKVYGERNSGTNYLEQLIVSNFDVNLLKYVPSKSMSPFLVHSSIVGVLHLLQTNHYLGWKHGVPPVRHLQRKKHKDLILFTATKNPYPFLLSLYKRPYHQNVNASQTFSQFIRTPWQTIMRERLLWKQLSNPIELWNIKNRSYLELNAKTESQVFNIKYEDLLNDPFDVLENLQTQIPILKTLHSNSQNVLDSTKGDNITFEEYQSYYLEEKWRSEFDQDDIEFINTHLDPLVMKQYNYTFLP